MKQVYKCLQVIIMSLFLFPDLNATIIRVNNTGVDADYTNLQTALNSANSGDSIYVEASPVSYGTITVNNEIHLFGTGYFIGQNLNLQANINSSEVLTLYLNSGCDNSTIQGLTITTLTTSNTNATFEDVIVRRNLITSGVYINSNVGITNMFLIENYIDGFNSTYNTLRTSGNGVKTITVLNNIFYTSAGVYARITIDANTIGTFKNNIFHVYGFYTEGCSFKNNILLNNAALTNPSLNTYYNNICPNTQFPSGNGNQQNVNISTVCEGFPTQGSYTNDSRFVLKAGSPASGTGEGGIDCGVFDGDANYVLSGIPAIPTIYKFISPSIVNGNFNVTISTRSNN